MVAKVNLRLDDGSIVSLGEDGVANRITATKDVSMNKLGERDAARLEQFIATARSMAPKGSIVDLSAPSMASKSPMLTQDAAGQIWPASSNVKRITFDHACVTGW